MSSIKFAFFGPVIQTGAISGQPRVTKAFRDALLFVLAKGQHQTVEDAVKWLLSRAQEPHSVKAVMRLIRTQSPSFTLAMGQINCLAFAQANKIRVDYDAEWARLVNYLLCVQQIAALIEHPEIVPTVVKRRAVTVHPAVPPALSKFAVNSLDKRQIIPADDGDSDATSAMDTITVRAEMEWARIHDVESRFNLH